MGKTEEVRAEAADLEAAGAAIGGGGAARIFRGLSPRCILVLVLTAGLLLSVVFWLPPFYTRRSEFALEDPDSLHAAIQASFILPKPISILASGAARLEYEILEEIGVPNSKVSIVSMHSLPPENSTHVVFGFLPDPKNASISTPAISILRSTMINLVLRQINISLTSAFGHPSSFEVLRFPGGITVVPLQSASIWEIAKILFHFRLNNSMEEILENIDSLKAELKFGLSLRSYENVYVKLTNYNGSTVAPPVVVHASVLSDVGSGSLLPDRMRQLAQVITGPNANNLGLNNTVFGKVKQVQLSSYLEHSISSLAPAPSPSISPSPSYPEPPASSNPIPHPAAAPAPSYDHRGTPPCFYPHTPPPESPLENAPAPRIGIQPHLNAYAPGPSPRITDPSNCYSCPSVAPSTSPAVHPRPPISSDHSSTLGSPSHDVPSPSPKVSPGPSPTQISYAFSPMQDARSGGRSSPSPLSPFISPSSSSKAATFTLWEARLTLLLGFSVFLLACTQG